MSTPGPARSAYRSQPQGFPQSIPHTQHAGSPNDVDSSNVTAMEPSAVWLPTSVLLYLKCIPCTLIAQYAVATWFGNTAVSSTSGSTSTLVFFWRWISSCNQRPKSGRAAYCLGNGVMHLPRHLGCRLQKASLWRSHSTFLYSYSLLRQ
jgi:hypothetical protein